MTASDASETNSIAKLVSPDSSTSETISRLRRVRHLRIAFPRMERLCRPQSETFWAIGGRPGTFKTGLLWNLAVNTAMLGQRVIFVSLEMTPGEIGLLALTRFSGLSRKRVEIAFMAGGQPFNQVEQAAWDAAVLKVQSLELFLRIHGAEEHGRSIDDVLHSASRARFDAVFVDHLGMIGRDSSGRELDVLSNAIHRLRGLSRGEVVKDYRPWVVATSQLNREIDKGDEDRIPRLADFRGSARIEHDTDVAIGLQVRPRTGESAESTVDGFVLKNRNGPCPLVTSFIANGSIGLLVERHSDPAEPPAPWQDREPGEDG